MSFDVITLGRVSLDLFSMDIGAPFVDITAFDTGSGGSPTNIAVGTSRLGLQSSALTAVGNDPVGDFVIRFLNNEKVHTDHIARKNNYRTGVAVLGIEPPDKFPLVFYREDAADIHFSIEDIMGVNLAEAKILLLSGTALSRGECRDTTLFAAETARAAEIKTVLDLDFRADQWQFTQSYGLNIRTILDTVDVVIGTEEEFYLALAPNPAEMISNYVLTDEMHQELSKLIDEMLQKYKPPALVLKRGAKGVTIYYDDQSVDVLGFPVEVVNTVGAGDAFASGLIYGMIQGWDWPESAKFANACGALVVTRHGCSKAMPYLSEVQQFLVNRSI